MLEIFGKQLCESNANLTVQLLSTSSIYCCYTLPWEVKSSIIIALQQENRQMQEDNHDLQFDRILHTWLMSYFSKLVSETDVSTAQMNVQSQCAMIS